MSGEAPGRHPRGTLLLHLATTFLGAGLLFGLQPLVGKLVLSRLGGAPAVWNTCLLFFQGMLLAGYAYAHYGTRFLGLRRHALLHVVLLALSLAVLPPAFRAGEPPATGSPAAWLLSALATSIGLPFFALAATAPLVQHWLSRSHHPAGRDPYFLYAASNLGSMTGLVLYPLVLEPLTGLAAQAAGWTGAHVVFTGLVALLAIRAVGAQDPAAPPPEPAAAPGVGTAARWLALAFVPSALLLTVTAYVTTDLTPMPLLWIVPLALYLGSFVAAFGSHTAGAAGALRRIQPFATLVAGVAVLAGYHQGWLVLLHLAVLAIASYLAHARLAGERPHPSRLTAFYLWIAAGGTLGGVFGAIIAPLLLTPELEYVLLLLAALLVPGSLAGTNPPPLRRALIGVAAGCALGLVTAQLTSPLRGVSVAVLAASGFLLRSIEPRRVVLAAGTLLVFSGVAAAVRVVEPGDLIARERNFFGTLRVRRTADAHELLHGRTRHGAQLLAPDQLDTPTTYYSREGPLGDVFTRVMQPVSGARVAAIGLGVGTAACYARAGEAWLFVEIDPGVVKLARDTTLFRFLHRCGGGARVVIADGRAALRQDRGSYDLIVLDAFSSDAIPSHLLTREAFELYLRRLRPGGVLAAHISNRHLDLAPVVASHAAALGLSALIRSDDRTETVRRSPSTWAALARDPARIEPLLGLPGWRPLPAEPGFRAWTDDYTSLVATLRVLRGTNE